MSFISMLRNKLKMEWIWLKLSYKFRFAHHPTCGPYSNQVFNIFGVHLCQGCTLLTIGIFIGSLGSLIAGIKYNFISLLAIVLCILILFGIVDGLGLPRTFKRLTRISMGIGIGIAIYVLIFDPEWLIKGITAFLGYSMYKGYNLFRAVYPSKDLCASCELLKDAPYCPGLITQMHANKKYQELVLPMFEAHVARKLGINGLSSIQKIAQNNVSNENNSDDQEFDIIWS